MATKSGKPTPAPSKASVPVGKTNPSGKSGEKAGSLKPEDAQKVPETLDKAAEEAAIEAARKKSMSRYGNLLTDQHSDHWDEGLIPQDLVDEIYAELQYESGSDESEESYIDVTESGTVVKKYRKKRRVHEEEEEESSEEEEEEGTRRLSVPDVEGGISKAKLKLMSIRKLNSIHKKIDQEIEFIQTENFIMDRTVKKMEKRELEIEAALPAFTYQFPWEKDNVVKSKARDTAQDTCAPKLSSGEEDEDDGVYVPFIPVNELDFSDPYFDDMSEHMRQVTTNQMRDLGEIAPVNFDVIRHTYGDLVKPVPSDLQETEQEDSAESRGINQSEGGNIDSPSASQAFLMNKGLEASSDQVEDEDPEFPGFVMKQAKKLPIGEKLKYANIEEESLREEFFDDETNGIQQENSIQVYIDTFINSVELIRKLQDTLKESLANGYHPLTGRMRAEVIARFRKLMKNRLLSEETKLTMALNELKKRKKKVDEQVKSNRELGESIQLIDYEQLRIENAEFQGSLDDEHDKLKQLKIITASCFQQLKEHRAKLHYKILEYKHIHDDVAVRGVLMDGFDENTEKYSKFLHNLKTHNEFLRKRLKVFKAPSTIDYMRQKAQQNIIQDEIILFKKKVESLKINLRAARNNIRRMQKKVPAKDIRKLNKDWLEEIKREVKEKGLINLLENENDPMGGSMRSFFKKKGDLIIKADNPKALEKKDSDTPSQIKLGPAALDQAKENQSSLFPRRKSAGSDDAEKKSGSLAIEPPQQWDHRSSLRPVTKDVVNNNLVSFDEPPPVSQSRKNSPNLYTSKGRRKTLSEVKSMWASESRKHQGTNNLTVSF